MKYVNKSEIFNQLKGQEELPDLKPTYKNVFYSFFQTVWHKPHSNLENSIKEVIV